MGVCLCVKAVNVCACVRTCKGVHLCVGVRVVSVRVLVKVVSRRVCVCALVCIGVREVIVHAFVYLRLSVCLEKRITIRGGVLMCGSMFGYV